MLDQFLDVQKKTGRKLGEIVGKLGIVTKKDVDQALKEQVEEARLAIVVSVLGFNLIGDGLREALDPKLRGRA